MKIGNAWLKDICGIYSIYNHATGEMYIGQSKSVGARGLRHMSNHLDKNDAGYNLPLYCSMREYGLNNFSFQVVEMCKQSELNQKEQFGIEKLKKDFTLYNKKLV